MKLFLSGLKKHLCLLAATAAFLSLLCPGLAAAADDDAVNDRLVTPVAPADTPNPSEDEVQPPADGRMTGTNVLENSVTLTLGSDQAIVHGAPVTVSVAPFATNNTTMLPLRFIAQDILGAEVTWDNEANIVRVYRQGSSITIALNSGKIYADGQPYDMPVKPMVRNYTTVVPLRVITELMDCQVLYNAEAKQVSVVLPEPVVVEPPVADITYLSAFAGQTVEYWDSSYDPAGYPITEREWTVTDAEGNTKTGASLYWLFYQRQGGDYHITYRVKNSYGVWSEPVESEYRLGINNPPEVTMLTAHDTSVDIGEALDIKYDFTNEDWEEITDINFTYSWTDKKGEKIVKKGMPPAFFAAGKYTVTLTVQDAFGQQSNEATLDFEVSDRVQATEAEYRFYNPTPGDIFLNIPAFNFYDLMHAVTTGLKTTDITLVDSNSPEQVGAPALLYKDTVSGNASVHYHHLNKGEKPLKFYIIAHNQTDKPVTYTLGKSGFAGPSPAPVYVGYIESQNYLGAVDRQQTVTLKPGEMSLLNSAQTAAVPQGGVQSALVDLQINGQLTIAVVAMDETAAYRTYQTLPAIDSTPPQTRGTYNRAAYDIDIRLGDTPEKIRLGYPDSFSGMVNNYLVEGIDKLSGMSTYNKGNYGVVHRLRLTATEDTGILVNPRGSVYRGAILWNDELCLVPAAGQLKTMQESVVAGVIKAGETVTITYITPDGSDSPVLLIAIPESYWSEF